jgi:CheY-like chemotaxis protein
VKKVKRIIWLEDEPETIDVITNLLKEYCDDILVRQSFIGFSNELEDFEDVYNNVIIIDIRMIFSREMSFSCFEKEDIKINNELDSGFEYFNHCIKKQFKEVKVIFFTSKPKFDTMKDARKHKVNTSLIVSKDFTLELIEIIKGMS